MFRGNRDYRGWRLSRDEGSIRVLAAANCEIADEKKKRKKEGRKRFDRRVCQVLAPHMTVRNPRRIRGAQSRVYSRPTIHRDESLFNQTVVVRSNNRDKALSRAGYAARFLRRSRKKTRVHRPTRMFRGVEHR